jgi:hypothetical protein
MVVTCDELFGTTENLDSIGEASCKPMSLLLGLTYLPVETA